MARVPQDLTDARSHLWGGKWLGYNRAQLGGDGQKSDPRGNSGRESVTISARALWRQRIGSRDQKGSGAGDSTPCWALPAPVRRQG